MSEATENMPQPIEESGGAKKPGAVADLLRGPWSIAIYTWREGMRKKTLVGFLILSILVIFGANILTSFVGELESASIGTDVESKLIKDICITTISIFGVLITIFISASVVPTEVDNKVVYTVLSKPIRRIQYLLGKFMGVQLVVLANLALMGVLFAGAVWAKEGLFPQLLLWAVGLTYFEFLVVSALTFAVSCTSSSSVLPTISGLFIYIVGHLTEYLRSVYERAEAAGSTDLVNNIIANIAWLLHKALPNLQSFSLRHQLVEYRVDSAPLDVQIPFLIAYSLLFAGVGFVVAHLVFRRKEL